MAVHLWHFSNLLIIYHLYLGIKFIVITDPRQMSMDGFLKRLYEIYADYALKNPFYSIDMPIRLVPCELVCHK